MSGVAGILCPAGIEREREEVPSVAVGIVWVLIIMLNGYGTIKRNQVWTDEVTLWQDVVDKYPKIPRAHNNLGVGYQKRGRG